MTIGAGVGMLALAAFADRAAAEPLVLDEAALDDVAAGFGSLLPGTSRLQRSTNITTSISMPMSTAIAVCFLCSGNATAVAIANAIGSGRADSIAFSFGDGQTFALSNAVGPYLIFVPSPAPAAGGPPSAR
ncbi:MAG TPA: hypothetical protein VFG47_22620 [Geminicoccaceae bacterium]|nr:hypothetical protein [Geminicoccaceae bacterium]